MRDSYVSFGYAAMERTQVFHIIADMTGRFKSFDKTLMHWTPNTLSKF